MKPAEYNPPYIYNRLEGDIIGDIADLEFWPFNKWRDFERKGNQKIHDYLARKN